MNQKQFKKFQNFNKKLFKNIPISEIEFEKLSKTEKEKYKKLHNLYNQFLADKNRKIHV